MRSFIAPAPNPPEIPIATTTSTSPPTKYMAPRRLHRSARSILSQDRAMFSRYSAIDSTNCAAASASTPRSTSSSQIDASDRPLTISSPTTLVSDCRSRVVMAGRCGRSLLPVPFSCSKSSAFTCSFFRSVLSPEYELRTATASPVPRPRLCLRFYANAPPRISSRPVPRCSTPCSPCSPELRRLGGDAFSPRAECPTPFC